MSHSRPSYLVTFEVSNHTFTSEFDSRETALQAAEVVTSHNIRIVKMKKISPTMRIEHVGHECTIFTEEERFSLTPHGRGHLIRCNEWLNCSWWKMPYLALTSEQNPPIAFWNERLQGYVVRNRHLSAATQFVKMANES